MNVGIFYSSISNIQKAPHKQFLMDAFRQGVLSCGDNVKDYKNKYQKIDQLDAGFILGYTLENNHRRKIIDTLKLMKAKIIFVDSNIFSYSNKFYNYHRYSVDSVYPTDGEYFLGKDRNSSKLQQILNFHNITIKPWRKTGDHILLLGQRTLSWNMLNKNGADWIIGMIVKIKQYTDRKIVIRLHPGDTTYNLENRKRIQDIFGKHNITISNHENIRSDLENAWCSVGYNSTPACVSAIEGIPVYLDNPLNSWARDVGFDNLKLLETPPMPERNEWLEKIANIHWNTNEIENGLYWKRFKNFYNV